MKRHMITFSLVKKIGEGNYLNDDRFILERVRRERALDRTAPKKPGFVNRIFAQND